MSTINPEVPEAVQEVEARARGPRGLSKWAAKLLIPELTRLTLGLIFAAITGLVGHYVGKTQTPQDQGSLNQARGSIRVPGDRTFVDPSKDIECSGTIEPNTAGLHYWLAVETEGFIWFKKPELSPGRGTGKWTAKFREQGTAKRFGITLFAANDETNSFIEGWFANGEANGGRYAECRWLRGADRLDRIDVAKGKFEAP